MSLFRNVAPVSRAVTALVVLAVLGALVVVLAGRDHNRYVTVDFQAANSLYPGSDVKILGVRVGKVESLTPRGKTVRVKLSYSDRYQLPSDVKAAIVSPSIIGDRFVQLAPAYTGGAVLADHALLGLDRSAVPVELDKVYRSLDDLAIALGPHGVNKSGSLSRVLDNSAQLLTGEGGKLNAAIKDFSQLSQTLADNKDDLFGSLNEVGQFVATLKEDDATVRNFNDSTARVAAVLAGEREDLAGTLKALSLALNDVHTLVKDNRVTLRDNIDNIAALSQTLADNKKSLEETIIAGPTALSNVAFSYNDRYGTLDTRSNLTEILTGGLNDPKLLLCSLLGESGGKGDVCSLFNQLAPQAATSQPPAAKLPAPELVNDSIGDMLGLGR